MFIHNIGRMRTAQLNSSSNLCSWSKFTASLSTDQSDTNKNLQTHPSSAIRLTSCCHNFSPFYMYLRTEQKRNVRLSCHPIAELIRPRGRRLNHLRVQTGEHRTLLHYGEKLLKQPNEPRLAFQYACFRPQKYRQWWECARRNTANYKLRASKYAIKT